MSFATVEGSHYVKRTRVFTNSDEGRRSRSDEYKYTIPLEEHLTQVFSIELVQYNVPTYASPTYVGWDINQFLYAGTVGVSYPDFTARATINGANGGTQWELTALDGVTKVVLETQIDPTVVIFFPLFLAGTPLGAPTAVLMQLYDLVFKYADWSGANPALQPNLSDYTLRFTLDSGARVGVGLQHNASGDWGTVRVLNGTGTERTIQSSSVLGFRRGQDTVPQSHTGMALFDNLNNPVLDLENAAVAPFQPNAQSLNYLDIFLDETPNFIPHSRVCMASAETSVEPIELATKPRILKQPIRSLRELNIRLKLKSGADPAQFGTTGVDLVFDILSLEPVPDVPQWLGDSQVFAL